MDSNYDNTETKVTSCWMHGSGNHMILAAPGTYRTYSSQICCWETFREVSLTLLFRTRLGELKA